MEYTLDTPLGTLLDLPQAKTIIDQYLPGVTSNPMVGMIRGMTLSMVLAMPQAAMLGLTKEKAEAILADLNKKIK